MKYLNILGLVDPNFYSRMMNHISSHGFVILSPYKWIGYPGTEYKAEWMEKFESWAKENLLQKLLSDGFDSGLQLDFSTIFVMGHSSGNHITINYLKLGCHNVKGMVLLNPVDGVDPFGFVNDFCIVPGEKLPFSVPTLIMTAGYDSVPGFNLIGDIVPPCAPEELSNMRFYEASNGPLWLNNATLFGHVDFMDPEWVPTIVSVSF